MSYGEVIVFKQKVSFLINELHIALQISKNDGVFVFSFDHYIKMYKI